MVKARVRLPRRALGQLASGVQVALKYSYTERCERVEMLGRRRALAVLVAAATASLTGTAYADRVAPSNAPVKVGQYVLITDTPDFPQEDEIGWNCYIDGNGRCGSHGARKARGFARPGWHVECRYYLDSRWYVMCSDGAVFMHSATI